MFNFIDIYSFIPVSGCVGMGPVHCFARGPMILLRCPWVYIITEVMKVDTEVIASIIASLIGITEII